MESRRVPFAFEAVFSAITNRSLQSFCASASPLTNLALSLCLHISFCFDFTYLTLYLFANYMQRHFFSLFVTIFFLIPWSCQAAVLKLFHIAKSKVVDHIASNYMSCKIVFLLIFRSLPERVSINCSFLNLYKLTKYNTGSDILYFLLFLQFCISHFMEFSLYDIIKSLYRILKCFIYIGSKRVSLPFTIGISGLIIQQIIISILNKIFCISPIYLFHFCRIILQGMMTILKSLKKLE